MEPVCVSSKPSYLHAAGAATFKAMTDSDPQAVWWVVSAGHFSVKHEKSNICELKLIIPKQQNSIW